MEETGELMLQTGCFSLRDFIQIFTDKEVGAGAGGWAVGGVGSTFLVCRWGAGHGDGVRGSWVSGGGAGTSLCLLMGGGLAVC